MIVAIGRWGKSASSYRVVRAVSPGGKCIALQLQFCLVSSSPSKVGQFSFECCPLSHKISSKIHHLPHFGRLSCCPIPLSAFVPLQPLLGIVAPVGGWLVTLSLLSAFAALPAFIHWEFGTESWLFAPPPFSGKGSVFHPHFHCGYYIIVGHIYFSVLLGAFSLPRCYTGLFSLGVDRGVRHGVWCSPVPSAGSHKQLWNQPVRRNGVAFLIAAFYREAFHGLGIQDVAEFDSDWCSIFCFWGGKKKRSHQGAFLPGPDMPSWLCAVLHFCCC
jgi:hypothetical protein